MPLFEIKDRPLIYKSLIKAKQFIYCFAFVCVSLFAITNTIKGQVVINELGIKPANNNAAGGGEFIELFNKGAASVNIGCYTVLFSSASSGGNPVGWTITIPANTILTCGQYYLIGGAGTTASGSVWANCTIGGNPWSNGYAGNGKNTADLNIATSYNTGLNGLRPGNISDSKGQVNLFNTSGVIVSSVSFNSGNVAGSYTGSFNNPPTGCTSRSFSNPGNATDITFASGDEGIFLNSLGLWESAASLTPGKSNSLISGGSQTGLPTPSITLTSAASVCFSTSSQTTTLGYSSTTNSPDTYSITWNSTPTNSFVPVTNATLSSSPISISVPANTAAGTYTGTITVKNACNQVSTGVNFTLTVSAAPAAPTITLTQPTCTVSTGTITITAPTGTGLSYSIDGINYTNTTGIFTGLSPNTYNVTVKNATGCTSSVTAVTLNNVSTAPAVPTITLTQPTCTVSTGTITITAPTGTGLTYSIDGITYTNTTGIFASLLPNTYNVTVKDAGGCISSITTATINSVPVAPAAPNITLTQPSCTVSTGTITITAPTGTGLTYSIDGITYTNTTGIFASLLPNTFNVTVKDAGGCISSITTATINASGGIPSAPTVTSPVNYCQNATATALTSTGTNLLWYTTATGGTGSSIAPIPATSTTGNTNYYVSQTVGGCESVRSLIVVSISTSPTINTISNQSLCTNTATTAINFSGNGLAVYNWTNSTPSIGLAANGTGNISSFTALNSGSLPVTATITATPVSSGYAYIANYGVFPFPAGNTISVINTTTNIVVGSITVGSNPFGVAITPDGTKVFVTNYGSNNVSVINTATNTVIATITVGSQPQGIVLSPDGTKAYVANQSIIGIGSVSVINTATNTVAATITVGYQPQGLAISPDGSRVYVANVNSNNISVINTTTNTVSTTIGVGTQPICVGISPDGSKLFVPNFGNNNVSVINTATNTVATNVAVGTNPDGATVSPDGTKVYITNQTSNNFSVLNTATNAVTATVAVGTRPQGISFTSDGTKAYIANSGSNNVSVIDAITNTVLSTVTVGAVPFSLGNFVTSSNGCSGTPTTFTITVNPKPAAPLASVTTQPSCSVTTGTISVSNPTGIGFTYSIDDVNYTNTTGVFSGLIPGNYNVTVKNATGCISLATVVTVNAVPSPPAAPTATSAVNYCQNATATALTATGTNLLWYTVASGGTGSSTAPTPVTTSTGTVNYYVSQTIGGCESSRAIITVTVNAAPAAPSSTSTVSYCQNATATALTATGTNLLWYTVATGGTGSSTAPTPITTTTGITNFYVSQTVGGCESPRATIAVIVNAAPIAPSTTATVSYCQNAVATALTAAGTNLLWYTVATGGTGTSTAPTPITTSTGTTNYYVSQTTNSCEGPRSIITVTVNAIPATPSANSPVNYCQNAVATALTATGNNLLWYTAAIGGTGLTTAPTPATNTIGNSSYFVSQSNGTCESSRKEIVVTVNAIPSAPTVNSPVNYCEGDIATILTATGTNLLWYNSIGAIPTTTAPTPSTGGPGNFTFYTSQTVNGCESILASIVVNIYTKPPIPTITANGSLQICTGNVVVLSSSSLNNNQWYKDGNIITGATTSTYTVTQAGNYTVEVSNANGCKSISTVSSAAFYANPVPVGIDKNVFEGDSVVMTNYVTGGNNFSYSWFPNIYLSNDTILNPWVIKPLSDMLYTLTVVNENGCTGNATVFIRLLKELIIPNAFSPNGDKVNDTWELLNLNLYTNCSVDIFDRNGQVVFHSIGYQKPWDGTMNGRPAPVGVYYYIIDRKNNKPKYSGWVTLLR